MQMIPISGHHGGCAAILRQQQRESPRIMLPYPRRDLCQSSPMEALSLLAFCPLKGTGTSARSSEGPPGTDCCVSPDVDLEALSSQRWQTAALEVIGPSSRRRERQEERNQRDNEGRKGRNAASYLEFNPIVLPAEVP